MIPSVQTTFDTGRRNSLGGKRTASKTSSIYRSG